MSELLHTMKTNFVSKLLLVAIFTVRAVAGLLLGLSVALAAQEAMNFSLFTFMFTVVSITSLSLYITKGANLLSAIIFLLVLILIGVLLKLYIQSAVAP